MSIEINLKQTNSANIAELAGEIDANTAPKVQTTILALVTPGCKLLLDMSEVSYLSSAGLRILLVLYRQTLAQEGKLVLVGLSEEVADTMHVTGFLDFFTTCNTVEQGLAVLG